MEFNKVIAIAVSPVAIVEQYKLHWVRLHIYCKVAQMGEGVDGSQDEDDGANHLVQKKGRKVLEKSNKKVVKKILVQKKGKKGLQKGDKKVGKKPYAKKG